MAVIVIVIVIAIVNFTNLYNQGYIYPIIDSAPVCGGSIESELNSLIDAINEAVGAY